MMEWTCSLNGTQNNAKQNSKLKVEGKTRKKSRECWMIGVKNSIMGRDLMKEDAMDNDLWRQQIAMGGRKQLYRRF